MSDTKYIHGFSKEEQQRLLKQAHMQESHIYGNVDFSSCKTVLEVGCGVGAQTLILCERYPHLQITSVDTSEEQIQAAHFNLKNYIEKGQVILKHVGTALPFAERSFDGAFLCWVLEHVPQPESLLRDVQKVLRPRGRIYCNEVLNSTFFVNPYSPNTLKYWFEFNDYQWSLGGDPFMGGNLANHLLNCGFKEVRTQVLTHQFDNREPRERAQFLDYWSELLLSGAPGLKASGRVNDDIVEGMKMELETLKQGPDSVIFYSWILAQANSE